MIVTNKLTIRYGVTGNYYAFSIDKKRIEEVCRAINKAESSIYWNEKYKCWAIRIKDKAMKEELKRSLELYGKRFYREFTETRGLQLKNNPGIT